MTNVELADRVSLGIRAILANATSIDEYGDMLILLASISIELTARRNGDEFAIGFLDGAIQTMEARLNGAASSATH